jgi:hypothetical protein
VQAMLAHSSNSSTAMTGTEMLYQELKHFREQLILEKNRINY